MSKASFCTAILVHVVGLNLALQGAVAADSCCQLGVGAPGVPRYCVEGLTQEDCEDHTDRGTLQNPYREGVGCCGALGVCGKDKGDEETVCESVPELSPCCLSGECEDLPSDVCLDAGGGACCLSDNTCINTDRDQCQMDGGRFHTVICDKLALKGGCDPPIPATSEWGLAVLALVVLIAGTVVLRRRQTAGA